MLSTPPTSARRTLLLALVLAASVPLSACGSSVDVDDGSDDDAGADTSSSGDSSVVDARNDSSPTDSPSKDTTSSDTTPTPDTTTTPDTSTTPDTTSKDTSTTPDTPTKDTATDATEAGSCAGIECAGFPSSFADGCTVDDNCIGELHETDCCGAMRAIGMNHSDATTFCADEFGGSGGAPGCRASYPSPPGCSSDVITADDGTTTTDPTKLAVHCVLSSSLSGQCKTFVCGLTGGLPCPTSRRIGSCGP